MRHFPQAKHLGLLHDWLAGFPYHVSVPGPETMRAPFLFEILHPRPSSPFPCFAHPDVVGNQFLNHPAASAAYVMDIRGSSRSPTNRACSYIPR